MQENLTVNEHKYLKSTFICSYKLYKIVALNFFFYIFITLHLQGYLKL